jgi:uncharacterized lipoprotein YddW (UPF0748 family)
MIVAIFIPEPTQPPIITQPSGTRYASIIQDVTKWLDEREAKEKVKRTYKRCKESVKRQSVLGHWNAETQQYQLLQQCGNDPGQPPTITIVRG